jgi:hypothetical protein
LPGRELPGLPHPAPSPLGVSHTPRGLLLRAPSQLCFMLQPHIGFPALIRKECRINPASYVPWLPSQNVPRVKKRPNLFRESSTNWMKSTANCERHLKGKGERRSHTSKETKSFQVSTKPESRKPQVSKLQATSLPREDVPTREGSSSRPKPFGGRHTREVSTH